MFDFVLQDDQEPASWRAKRVLVGRGLFYRASPRSAVDSFNRGD